MPVIKYLQLPFFFDAGKLQQEVDQLADTYWKMHYQTLQYTGGWSAIPLKSADGSTGNIFISPTSVAYQETILLKECPYISQILAGFHCTIQAVRLLKLDAGAVIKEHKDIDLCFEKGEARIHIPVYTHEDVAFYLDKERMAIKEGECWYMNFNLPHHISNNSSRARIHLVMDVLVNDWLQEIFYKETTLPKKLIDNSTVGYDDEVKRQMIKQFREMNTETSNKLADDLEQGLIQPS